MTTLQALFSFRGRMSRRQFWLKGILVLSPVLVFGWFVTILTLVRDDPDASGSLVALGLIEFLVLLVPMTALYVKRLHDHNRSGWFLATWLIPIAQFFFMLLILVEVMCLRGTVGANRFGEDPVAGPLPPARAVRPRKRGVAAILAILLGTLGAHKVYLGRPGLAIVYAVFFWTGIPTILGFIEGLWYLWMPSEEFHARFERQVSVSPNEEPPGPPARRADGKKGAIPIISSLILGGVAVVVFARSSPDSADAARAFRQGGVAGALGGGLGYLLGSALRAVLNRSKSVDEHVDEHGTGEESEFACSECGADVAEDDTKCPNCGGDL